MENAPKCRLVQCTERSLRSHLQTTRNSESFFVIIEVRTQWKAHMKSLYLSLKWFNHIYCSVVEVVTSSPPGMQITSLRYNGGVYYRNVTWYPSQYQVGQQAFCFKAVDSSGWDDIFFVISFLGRYPFTKNFRDEDPSDEDCVPFEKFTMHLL